MKTINKTWNLQSFLNTTVRFKGGWVGGVARNKKETIKELDKEKTAVWQAFFGSNKELAVVYSMTYTLD